MKWCRKSITLTIDEIIFIFWSAVYYLGGTILQSVPYPIYIVSYLMVGIFAFVYVYCNGRMRKYVRKGIIICLLLNLFQICSLVYNGNGDIQELLYTWGFMGMALLIYKGEVRASISGAIFWGVIFSFAIAMLQGMDAAAYMRSSQNGVSGNIIFFLTLYYLLRYKEGKKIVYFPACLSLIFCVWGQGRAGIFTTIIFIGLLFVYDWFCVKGNKASSLLKIGCIIIVGLVGLCVFFKEYVEVFMDRWKIFGLQTSRYEIWQCYGIEIMNFPLGNILLGASTEGTGHAILDLYEGNLHNSFLMLHCRYGFLGVLVVISSIVSFVKTEIKSKCFFYIVVIITIGVRSCFDWTAFPGVYEILFYYLFFTSSSRA